MNPFEGYRLTSPFGYRIHPVDKVKRFHRGVDLVITPSNGPIKAFVAGEVLHAKMGVTGSGFGNMGNVVAVKDDTGHLHVYAHLSSVAVKVGQQVMRGQVVGNQGSTGKSTGPHLHYEVRKAYSPSFGWTQTEAGVVEPTQYLKDYYAQQRGEDDEQVDKAKVIVNGKSIEDGVLINGKTYVPLRAVGEAWGATVEWDNKTNTATVNK
ncbi:peptidoglycan DD-metalloendopeptidase family protein [Paenibacillus terrae]|uniref:peptidoglycan DD-metalloendopeptidase family protein n=1 Tax=Paenibacillus terrae TaxID=159743 RepID=UPI0006988ADF|nr:peptidoglycan DD-metalloendopeptidase family protein [Paenibacillus terrae]